MDIPLMAGAYSDYSPNINAQECLNLTPFMDTEENIPAFYGRPGLIAETELYADHPVRGIEKMGGALWAVVGNKLYKRTTAGVDAEKGTLDTTTGPVHFAVGEDKLFFTDGTSGYTVVADTFAKITDGDFPATPIGAIYIDGWYLTVKSGTGEFYQSALDDPTGWTSAGYAVAEGSPDNVQIPVNVNNDLWLIGDDTLEIWFDSGNVNLGTAFERVTGAIGYVGTGSPHSACVYNRTLYFIDQNRIARAAKGLDPQKISTRQIEYQWQQYSSVSDAIGYVIPFEGFEYLVFTFPTANATWVYNITTGLWEKWASYATDGRFRGTCYSYFNGKHLVGDHTSGKLLKLSSANYQDDGNAITRRITTRKISGGGFYLIHHNFEIELEPGHGTLALALTWSDDGGTTWSTGSTKTLANADYDAQAKWLRLGQGKNRIYKIATTSNAKIAIKGIAHAEISATSRR